MSTSIRSRRTDQRGAVAIVVAVCALGLFGCAAIAVDLGNAWARKRESQTQADLAALAGGSLLPKGDAANQTAIATEVADYLNDNRASSDQPTVSSGDLLDGDPANGEISFPTDTQLEVIAPQSRVDFGLAAALEKSHVNVAARATVEKRALLPDLDDVLPMWLPATCVYGPVEGDTDPHTAPATSATYTPTSVDSKFHITSMSTTSVSYGESTGSITVTLTNENSGAITGSGAIVFTFGAPTSWATADTVYPVTLNIPGKSGSTPGTQTVTIPGVGLEVSDTPGSWQVWAVRGLVAGIVVQPTSKFSDTGGGSNPGPGTFTVNGGGGEVACDDNQRGNFGQLDSRRKSGANLQDRYAYNVALGLDHQLDEFTESDYPSITVDPECFADNNPTGAKIDDDTDNGNDCIYVQSGNDPGGLTNGLLDGVSGAEGTVPGRLFSKPTSQRCVDNGRLAPAKPDSGHFNWSSINRDTLSCFLKDGYDLSDLAQDGAGFDLLDASVLESPRFFYVPVVYALDRADKKYIAIKQFAPVFITDETTTTSATMDNGVQMNGGGTQIFAVQVFAFNGNVIPVDVNNPDTEWFEDGRAVTRLVD